MANQSNYGFTQKIRRFAGAFLTPEFFAAHRDKITGGIEQLLSSVTSMVGLILLSRMMDINAFGIVAMAVGVWLIIEMIQSSTTIGPFILSCPNPENDREGFGGWIIWNVIFALILAVAFAITALLLEPYLVDFSYALLLSAPLCLTGILYMFLRRLHYHRMKRKALLTQTSLYALTYLLGIGWLYFQDGTPSPLEGSMVQIVAFGVPALVMAYPSFRDAQFKLNSLRGVWSTRKLIAEMGTAGFIWQLPYTITLLALGIFSTPAAVAIFTVTRTLVRPITLVMATISDVEVSKASRAFAADGVAGLNQVVHRARKALWLLNMVPIALLVLFPGFFLSLVYGEQYADATLEMQLRALLFLPLLHVAPLEMGLTVLRQTRYLLHVFVISLVGCFVYLLLTYWLGTIDAASALASLVAARIIVIPFLQHRYSRYLNNVSETDAGIGASKPYA